MSCGSCCALSPKPEWTSSSWVRRLIEVKRAAGRPKDLEAIAELEEILRESRSE